MHCAASHSLSSGAIRASNMKLLAGTASLGGIVAHRGTEKSCRRPTRQPTILCMQQQLEPARIRADPRREKYTHPKVCHVACDVSGHSFIKECINFAKIPSLTLGSSIYVHVHLSPEALPNVGPVYHCMRQENTKIYSLVRGRSMCVCRLAAVRTRASGK